MMLPNQITIQNFAQNGKGGYKAAEVDAFLQRVYQSYNKLYMDNKALCEKLDETIPLLDEYNKRKNSIADALIWAKSTAEKNIEEAKEIAEKLVADATEKAELIYEEKRSMADAYYVEKTAAADKRAKEAQAEYDSIKKQTEAYSEKFVDDINLKIQKMIEDANLKAASIVAEAYSDAKEAKEKSDSIVADANKELAELKVKAAEIKKEILQLISSAEKAAEAINDNVFEAFEINAEEDAEIISAEQIDVDEIEKFSLDGIEILPDDEEADEESEPVAIESAETENDHGYVRFFGNNAPDVDSLLGGIFTTISQDKPKNQPEEENSFRFVDIFADPPERNNSLTFNHLKKDSE